MAADKEAIGLYTIISVNRPHKIFVYSGLEHINTTCMHIMREAIPFRQTRIDDCDWLGILVCLCCSTGTDG